MAAASVQAANCAGTGTYTNPQYITVGVPVQPQQQQQQQQQQTTATTTNFNSARTAPPSTVEQWWRWLIIVLLVCGVGAGGAAIALEPWWVVTIGSTTTNFGIRDDWTSTITCGGGLDVAPRMILLFAMTCAGVGFAFFAWCLVFASGPVFDIARHITIFLSMSNWTTVLVMWGIGFQNCGNSCSYCSFGYSYWLAVGAGGCSLIALLVSVGQHISVCCSPPPPSVWRPTTTTAPATAMTTTTTTTTTTTAAAAAPQSQQQATVQQYEDAIRQLDYSQQQQQQQQPHAAAADHSFHSIDAFDPNDPASVGLGADWYYDTTSGYWWSDEAKLYYDHKSQMYGNPEDGTWYNPATGEWENPSG